MLANDYCVQSWQKLSARQVSVQAFHSKYASRYLQHLGLQINADLMVLTTETQEGQSDPDICSRIRGMAFENVRPFIEP